MDESVEQAPSGVRVACENRETRGLIANDCVTCLLMSSLTDGEAEIVS